MRIQNNITILLFLLLGITSCKKEQCLDGDGYPKGTERSLPEFTAVNINLSAVVELIQDTSSKVPYVELIVEENLETHLSTTVVKDTLNISLGFCFSSHADILIRVHYDSLNTIIVSGSGDVYSKSLIKQNDLKLDVRGRGEINLTTDVQNLFSTISGTGKVILNGQVRNHRINHTGSGSVNSYQAMTENVITNISGSGNNYLRVQKNLEANLSGKGNVYYKGNPIITGVVTSEGEVVDDN
jgi:hypothetical protein